MDMMIFLVSQDFLTKFFLNFHTEHRGQCGIGWRRGCRWRSRGRRRRMMVIVMIMTMIIIVTTTSVITVIAIITIAMIIIVIVMMGIVTLLILAGRGRAIIRQLVVVVAHALLRWVRLQEGRLARVLKGARRLVVKLNFQLKNEKKLNFQSFFV